MWRVIQCKGPQLRASQNSPPSDLRRCFPFTRRLVFIILLGECMHAFLCMCVCVCVIRQVALPWNSDWLQLASLIMHSCRQVHTCSKDKNVFYQSTVISAITVDNISSHHYKGPCYGSCVMLRVTRAYLFFFFFLQHLWWRYGAETGMT